MGLTLSSEMQSSIDRLRQKRSELIVSIGVLHNGTVQTLSLDKNGRAFAGDTLLYEIGSITKTFTACLLAKAVAEGRLDLSASFNRYIDGFPDGPYPSLRRLAVHASGYPSTVPFGVLKTVQMLLRANSPQGMLCNNPFHGRLDAEETLSIAKRYCPKDKDHPYAYNNFAYGLLGYTLEKAYSGTYWDVMQGYIQNELRLPNAKMGTEGVQTGYNSKNNPTGNWKWGKEDQVAAAGAISADVESLLQYLAYQLDDKNGYLHICHTQQGKGTRRHTMGLGWRLDKKRPYIWHDGNAGGFSCFAGFNKKAQTGAVVLTNYGLISLQDIGFLLLDEL